MMAGYASPHLSSRLRRVDDDAPTATTRDLAQIVFKRRWVIVWCIATVTTIAVAGVLALPPTYEAQAKVFVQTERQLTPAFFSGLVSGRERQDTDPPGRRLENEMALMVTLPVAERVVREMELGWADIYHPPTTNLVAAVLRHAGPWLESAWGLRIEPPSDRETVAAFKASISVGPAETKSAETTSNVIVVTLKAPDPERAREALDRLLAHYLEQDRARAEADGSAALALITRTASAATRDVETSRRAVREFLARSGFDPRNRAAEAREGLTVVSSTRDDQTVAALKATVVGLETQLSEVRQTYRAGTDPVVRLERTLAETRTHLAAEIDRSADNMARYEQLDRSLRAAESRADELERRREEIALFLQAGHGAGDMRQVLEGPTRPEESDWRARVATALLGSFMGLALGLVLAGLGEYADSSLGSREDVLRHIGVPVLATLPKASARERMAAVSPSSGATAAGGRARRVARAAETLASRLAASVTEGQEGCCGISLLVTSAHAGEGKSFTAALVASELVRRHQGRVLLVDVSGHDRKPMIDAAVPYARLSEDGHVLEPGEPGQTSATQAESSALTLLAVDSRGAQPNHLTGQRLQAFIDREKARFSWIVFDGRSAEGHGMPQLARAVDGVLLVVQADSTRRHVVRHAIDVLELDRPAKLAVVLNRKRHHVPSFLYERI